MLMSCKLLSFALFIRLHIHSRTNFNKYRLQKWTLMQITKYFRCLIFHISMQKEFSISSNAFIHHLFQFPSDTWNDNFPMNCQCQLLVWTFVFRRAIIQKYMSFYKYNLTKKWICLLLIYRVRHWIIWNLFLEQDDIQAYCNQT